VTVVNNHVLTGQVGNSRTIVDTGFPDHKVACGIGLLSVILGPGNLQLSPGNAGPLEAVSPQFSGRPVQALIQHPELAAPPSPLKGRFRVKLPGAGKQNVPVGQVEGPGVTPVIIMMSDRGDHSGFHFHLVHIPEGPAHEKNLFPIVGPVGPLPEMGQLSYIGRVVVPVPDRQALLGKKESRSEHKKDDDRDLFHV